MTKRRISDEAPTPSPACVPMIVGRMSAKDEPRSSGGTAERTEGTARVGRDPVLVHRNQALEQLDQVVAFEGREGQSSSATVHPRHVHVCKLPACKRSTFIRNESHTPGLNRRATPFLSLYAFIPCRRARQLLRIPCSALCMPNRR